MTQLNAWIWLTHKIPRVRLSYSDWVQCPKVSLEYIVNINLAWGVCHIPCVGCVTNRV